MRRLGQLVTAVTCGLGFTLFRAGWVWVSYPWKAAVLAYLLTMSNKSDALLVQNRKKREECRKNCRWERERITGTVRAMAQASCIDSVTYNNKNTGFMGVGCLLWWRVVIAQSVFPILLFPPPYFFSSPFPAPPSFGHAMCASYTRMCCVPSTLVHTTWQERVMQADWYYGY